MPSNKSVSDALITQFKNCHILKDHKLQREDLWIRQGKILNPEKLFFDEKGFADVQVDCQGTILAPGFIDVQINGGYGVDFSIMTDEVSSGILLVAKKLLSHGVTSFCPTLVSSPPSVYHKVLPQIKIHDGGPDGAGVLGVHLEGPFISKEKKGAHPEHCLRTFQNDILQELSDMYGSIDNVIILTLAPEIRGSKDVIREMVRRGITVSLGHSIANLSQAEEAVIEGASFITHLFNAMLPFHHRDPGIVGLLTSDRIPAGRTVFYGMIADGIHTNPAALRIAHRAHPKGLVLVTDAITAMGLPPGRHTLGQQVIEIEGLHAYVAGCSLESALEAASLHPAQLLGIEHRKGTLNYGADAGTLLILLLWKTGITVSVSMIMRVLAAQLHGQTGLPHQRSENETSVIIMQSGKGNFHGYKNAQKIQKLDASFVQHHSLLHMMEKKQLQHTKALKSILLVPKLVRHLND
ncbi:N-acetylglucosamine-6-phosphate deacetylase isoform X2 [Protopterus annectens]|uniref:N-acetylglucosamine-6-phosphate deacetylase isoform X2 n=1 Tax=Protopterus annectens TaxID=7888 RepID=UPI001CFAAF48|nr:N-acetylglucosamine-6-phosphate deacetylase isoform X2 [Protopterus annectens]